MALERNRVAAGRRLIANALNGLTTRGTPRAIAVTRGDVLILRYQVESLVKALGACFHELSPQVRVQAIELEKHLSLLLRATR